MTVTLKSFSGSYGANRNCLAADSVRHSYSEFRPTFEDHSRGNCGIRDRVDQDETSGRATLVVEVEEKRLACLDINHCDSVHVQIASRLVGECIHVDAV